MNATFLSTNLSISISISYLRQKGKCHNCRVQGVTSTHCWVLISLQRKARQNIDLAPHGHRILDVFLKFWDQDICRINICRWKHENEHDAPVDWGHGTSSLHKNSPRFYSLCLFPPSQVYFTCATFIPPHLSLRKVLLESFRSGQHGWSCEKVTSMGWHHRLEAKLNCIYKAALCSDEWLAATVWCDVPCLHTSWPSSQYYWTWYVLQLNNYFWYFHFGADRTKRTKQRTSEALEEHFFLGSQNRQLLSDRKSCNIPFFARSGELKSVRRKKLDSTLNLNWLFSRHKLTVNLPRQRNLLRELSAFPDRRRKLTSPCMHVVFQSSSSLFTVKAGRK